MNVDVFTKGLERANANRKQQDTNAKLSPVLTKPVLASSTVFDLEVYRIGIIAKAIAHINNKQRK
ncbi:hypothetical protein [Pseudomonas taiwanensis]|uniref:hypothetical protein n=1 Tax=Pseudomonas taiwanensis TaxID=470150 RepID=UPI000FFC71BA|nr:hypothetical protein [Pseudomonas taiwanensis]